MREETPRANRLHIGFFGRRNSGKSSLLNALCAQQVAIVSNIAGTTTDAVRKNMEIHGLGACVLTDTAGFDDEGVLGQLRVRQTLREAERVDVALLVIDATSLPGQTVENGDAAEAAEPYWLALFKRLQVPLVVVLNKADLCLPHQLEAALLHCRKEYDVPVVATSAVSHLGMEDLRQALLKLQAGSTAALDITGSLVKAGDVVVLVMPQDLQAPKGRLILPQVQTLRNLLDKGALAVSCTTPHLAQTLQTLAQPPHLIITDSQVFDQVAPLCPPQTLLTSFSVLFARYKGDIQYYMEGVKALMSLTGTSRVLIAEACSHIPLNEDIGRVKLPRLLHKRFGDSLHIDIVSGDAFPTSLSGYDLIIHCGACMFTRQHVLNRLQRAKEQHVPATNYGITIAALTGILPRVVYPD